MPYEFGRNTIGLAANAVDSVSSGLGSLLSTFTFDEEYIRLRSNQRKRKASGVREGFFSAGRNIGEGVWALSSFVSQPIDAAKKEGFSGFFKGVGKGLLSTFIKPIDKLGQAVSDITRGIQAECSKPLGALQSFTKRSRYPRLVLHQAHIRSETKPQKYAHTH